MTVRPPETILVGVASDSWVLQWFYDDHQAAAQWLAGAGAVGSTRVVYRIRLVPETRMVYVPPVPESLREEPIDGAD